MQPTVLKTVTVPLAPAFTLLLAATTVPLRVLIRNLDPAAATLTLSFTTADVQISSGSGTFTVPAGQSDVFVLQPKQSLFASASVALLASLAISEAVPIKGS